MQTGEPQEFRRRAQELRRLGEETRERARRIKALEDLRWRSRAADRFRHRVHERFFAQLSLAESLEDAAAAFDRLAAAQERAGR
jgi:Putative T7SS secretion signal domain